MFQAEDPLPELCATVNDALKLNGHHAVQKQSWMAGIIQNVQT